MRLSVPFGDQDLAIELPESATVLGMGTADRLPDPQSSISRAFATPLGSPPLRQVIRARLAAGTPDRGAADAPVACIVIADHTRPVPYKGDEGILLPVVQALRSEGVRDRDIVVLVGTGTHHTVTHEIEQMIDPRILQSGVRIVSHDSRNPDQLREIGVTERGTVAELNTIYLDAAIRISTGLVESHFYAGASGGRKAICPGIVSEATTYGFHSAAAVDSPYSSHLILDGNPHHEESLAIAQMAPPDFTVNVTLDSDYHLTGVFAGGLEAAHDAAVSRIREYVEIPITKPYDIVITHGGFVSINHYQAVKPALVARDALSDHGFLFLAAAHTDTDPVGSHRYRTLLHLLAMIGPEAYRRLVLSDDWTFLPDQWEVQSWAQLAASIDQDRFFYFAPQLSAADYAILPGKDALSLLGAADSDRRSSDQVQPMLDAFVRYATNALRARGVSSPSIAFLYDGPYGIVTRVTS